MNKINNIRNFSIIAHINHGKSTLSDRLIQTCGGLKKHEMMTQVLDSMHLERERGITIKARNVTLNYKALNNQIYQLNFIDTPGHVDFSYEVSRSMSACEGAILVVDSTQGVEAQTIANYYAALEMNLTVIPVINKIDLPSSDPDNIARDVKNILAIDTKDIIKCSAKLGVGILNILERIIRDIPSPNGDICNPLQALIIDSWFDNYLGIISLVCIKNGVINKGEKIKIMSTGQFYKVDRLGIFTPKSIERQMLTCGEVGWIICSIKDIHGAPVGDTITHADQPANNILPGFKKIKPQVYASMFPINSNDYVSFSNSLNKLSLNDSSLFYEPENSIKLGFGFRCGFLGLLHMEIIKERLKREYNLDLIISAPTVIYKIIMMDKSILYIDNPSKLPSLNKISELHEPMAECHMILPRKYLGNVINLCIEKRGIQTNIIYYNNQVTLTYKIPMAEVVLDFFNRLKSISSGYASLDYRFKCFQKSDLVRLDVFINSEQIDALTLISHRNNALYRGRELVNKLYKLIPRQQFNVNVQVAINNRIVSRCTVKQLRKDVISKCYGGDVSRKKKLLEKQKIGKKRLRKLGNITLPPEIFLAVLQLAKDSK